MVLINSTVWRNTERFSRVAAPFYILISKIDECSNFSACPPTSVTFLEGSWFFSYFLFGFSCFIFILLLWVFCMSVCLHTMCTHCPWGPEEDIRFLRTRVTDDCELPWGSWKSNLGLFRRAVIHLSCWAISPGLFLGLFMRGLFYCFVLFQAGSCVEAIQPWKTHCVNLVVLNQWSSCLSLLHSGIIGHYLVFYYLKINSFCWLMFSIIVLGIKPKALGDLGKCSTLHNFLNPHHSPLPFFFFF